MAATDTPISISRQALRYYSTATQTIANNTTTIVNFSIQDTLVTGLPAAWVTTGASWKFLPTSAGLYHVVANVKFAFSGGNVESELFLLKNGSSYQTGTGGDRGSTAFFSADQLVSEVWLNGSTDFIDIRAYQNSGASRNIGGAQENCSIIITRRQ